MKYQNLSAFEKHLETASKVQLSRVFLIVSACPYERKKIAGQIVSAIGRRESQIHYQVQEGAQQGGIGEWLECLNTACLLQGQQVLLLDGIDKLKKNAMASLCAYVASPSPFAYLLLGASSAKALAELYATGKRELIACDLSAEKPWDRKDRLKRSLVDYVAGAGKRMNGDALEYLLEHVGLSLQGLEQEAEKLICYVGDRQSITLQDVSTLCAAQKSATLWQLSDTIAWCDPYPKIEGIVDMGLLLPLLLQLRTQFQQGLLLAALLEGGIPHAEISHHVPSLRPAALDKILPIARQRKNTFFKRALSLLFEIEVMAKNSSFEPALILDLLLTKLTLLKRYYALSVPQSSY